MWYGTQDSLHHSTYQFLLTCLLFSLLLLLPCLCLLQLAPQSFRALLAIWKRYRTSITTFCILVSRTKWMRDLLLACGRNKRYPFPISSLGTLKKTKLLRTFLYFIGETRGLQASTRIIFLSLQWWSLVKSVRRVGPVNEIKWTIVFRLGCVESWILKLKTFIMDNALKNELHVLKDFIDIKIICLGNFLCEDFLGEISKPPKNKDLAFLTIPFSLLRWNLRRHFCVACTKTGNNETKRAKRPKRKQIGKYETKRPKQTHEPAKDRIILHLGLWSVRLSC